MLQRVKMCLSNYASKYVLDWSKQINCQWFELTDQRNPSNIIRPTQAN
uniref:Uncharacterized protein n=1 Tax=Rhizophora mucronata TaxID=61149 RepID=A0A2P2QJA1_RHIMU